MTTRLSNTVIVLIFGGFILYRTFYPSAPDDSLSSTIFNLAIELVGGILLYGLLQFLKNIDQLWFYFQTQFLFRKKEVRLSIAYLFRIKVDSKYLLVKNRSRNYFQPVGGVFKTLPGCEAIFEKLQVRSDRMIETDHGIAKNDLRVYVKGINVIEFLEWFNSMQDRETSPWREFCEELISTNILPWSEFRYIDYKYKGTVTTPIISLDNGDKGMFIYQIYDLVVNDQQRPILQTLLANGNKDEFIWADEYLINRLGHDERTRTYEYEISKHAKWALNMKWSKS